MNDDVSHIILYYTRDMNNIIKLLVKLSIQYHINMC